MTANTWAEPERRKLVAEARQLAHAALAETLPRRWQHTVGVAAAAEHLAGILAPRHCTEIICAAWLHDIGYAPAAVNTGFHPVDGAEYVTAHASADLALRTTALIAHHSGAVFEAHERGLQIPRAFPTDTVALAILNAADLSTTPDGLRTDPAQRLAEVLHRYPPEHPVHRAIAISGQLLGSQAALILGAAKTAKYREPHLNTPASATFTPQFQRWQAHWSGAHHDVTATLPRAGRGWVDIAMAAPAWLCAPQAATDFADALTDASAAAGGATLGWLQYRAFDVEMINGRAIHRGDAITFGADLATFHLADIVDLHLTRAAEGRAILAQQRTFDTLAHVTPWVALPNSRPAGPLELRHTQCPDCRSHHRTPLDPTRSPQGKAPPD